MSGSRLYISILSLCLLFNFQCTTLSLECLFIISYIFHYVNTFLKIFLFYYTKKFFNNINKNTLNNEILFLYIKCFVY